MLFCGLRGCSRVSHYPMDCLLLFSISRWTINFMGFLQWFSWTHEIYLSMFSTILVPLNSVFFHLELRASILQARIQGRWNGWIFTPLFLSPLLSIFFFLIPQILIGSNTLLQKFTPHFKILDPRLYSEESNPTGHPTVCKFILFPNQLVTFL